MGASKVQSRSLADKLAAAQRAALEVNEQRQIANVALKVVILEDYFVTSFIEAGFNAI